MQGEPPRKVCTATRRYDESKYFLYFGRKSSLFFQPVDQVRLGYIRALVHLILSATTHHNIPDIGTYKVAVASYYREPGRNKIG